MNSNNLPGTQQASGSTTQNNFMFGQTSLFGQSATNNPVATFGQNPIGQSPPMFGQLGNNQSVPTFGQNTSSQSLFGQTTATQSSFPFGQTSTGQSAPTFGQALAGLSAPTFGQTTAAPSGSLFGQTATGQFSATFGQTSVSQSAPAFGQGKVVQSATAFGQGSVGQSAPAFGQGSVGQSAPAFGQGSVGQSAPAFGQGSAGQSAPAFGQVSGGLSAPTFGQATFGQGTSGQSAPAFGQGTSGQSAPAFGQGTSGQSAPGFGQGTSGQSAPGFGQSTSGQSAQGFGQGTLGQSSPGFGQSTSGQSAPAFGQAVSGQTTPAFGQSTNQSSVLGLSTPTYGFGITGQAAPSFGKSTVSQPALFGHFSSGQTNLTFGQGNTSQASVFGLTTTSQSASPFTQAPTSQSTTAFSQTTSNQSASLIAQPAPNQSAPIFGNNATAFGQAGAGSSGFEQTAVDSSQSSLFGQKASGNNFTFGSQASGQTPMQKTNAQSFSQTTSTQSVQSTSSFSASGFQSTFSKPGAKLESSVVPEYGQLGSAQPPSYAQATSGHGSTFGNTSTTLSGKTNVFVETSDKSSVFGQASDSSSGQAINAGQAFGATTQINSARPDSRLTTSMTASPFSQISSASSAGSDMNFKPPTNTFFKPILTGTSKPNPTNTKSEEHPTFGIPPGVPQNSGFFNLSSDKKSKDDTASSRPPFASADSNFSSFAEEVHKGIKRKDDQGRSPRRNEFSSSDDASSDVRSDHPPVKRSGRTNRDLAGANLLLRSLNDAFKSQIKAQHRPETKKEDEVIPQRTEPDPDFSAPTHSFGRSNPPPASNQTRLVKTSAASVASQSAFSKSQLPAAKIQATSSRMVSVAAPNSQAPGGDQSTASANQLVSLLEEGELPEDIEDTTSEITVNKEKDCDSSPRSVPLSPTDPKVVVVRNLPPNLNQKQIVENYFKKFGKIQRLYSRPNNRMAIIHYSHHNSAAAAKKAGKRFHKDVSIFYQRKKTSPTKKDAIVTKKQNPVEEREERLTEEESGSISSPVRSSLFRGLKSSPHKKSMFSKTLQFDMDSPDAPASSSDTVGTSLKPSLLHLVGTVAETSEEKYRLLDQRDKILRQARVKRTELDQAKLFVGTCPDMCPEKERYMRETRKQLSNYELFPGTDKVNHAAAIKEYSRSSADQEEPLPHELRPLPVLCMTMDYLVTRIMNKDEENYRDWYDFVWNRTRGIRKDITQQHLSDPLTVSLMEKCMRFHIHCAHELCEEPMSSFDPKINNENLTKCLQSLKEMYQDLQNRGEICPSEPEFRGYSVLLNLNKGGVLREVQQFPHAVRNSEAVKFAVKVFSALNSTNFVQFFRLVRSASYLNSCILHCYFNQVRRDALRVLNVAYTPSSLRPTVFPLDNVVRLLCFQSVDEATEFLTAYGLCVADGFVELSRTAFAEPEVPLPPKRSLAILNMRKVSVGEIVNGAPLPQYSLHVPVCSFDEQNKYIGSSSFVEQGHGTVTEKFDGKDSASQDIPLKRTVVVLPDTREFSSVGQSIMQPIVVPELPPSPPKPMFCDEDVVAVIDDIVEDIVKEFSSGIGQAGAVYISAALSESNLVADKLLGDVVTDFSKNIVVDVVTAETERVKEEKRRQAEEARLIRERERMISMVSQSECEALLTEVITDSIRTVSSQELQQAIQRDHEKRVLRCSLHVCDQLVGQSLRDEIRWVAKETLCEMQCCSKYIQRWREVLAARKKLRRQMRGFPAAPGSMGRSGNIKALVPSAKYDLENLTRGFIDLGHAGKLCVSFTRCQQLRKDVFHQMKVQHFLQELVCDASWKPLELPSLIVQYLTAWKHCIFWKLVLALPEITEPDDPNNVLSEWLKAKFSWAGSQSPEEQKQPVQTLTTYSSLESQEGTPVHVNVCVKVVHGPLTDSELEHTEVQKDLLGTRGVILLLPTQSDEPDVYWLSAKVQLKQLLQAKPFKPPPSLAILVSGHYPDSERDVEEELSLSDLITWGLICDYFVVLIPDAVNNLKGTEMVSSAVHFLLSHCPQSLELLSLPFQQYIEDGVCSAFSVAFYRDVLERRKAGLSSQDPAAIIDLYNDAIAFLAEAVSSTQLSQLSWPVTEFSSSEGSSLMPSIDWNSPEHLASLKNAVLSFQLPQMDKPPQGASWHPICSMIIGYVNQVSQSLNALPVLLSEVHFLLERIWKQWFEKGGDTDLEPPVEDIPWDDLIALCINHKLRDWKPPLTANFKGFHENLHVYFFKEDIKNFAHPETWENARLRTHLDTLVATNSPPQKRNISQQALETRHSLYLTHEDNASEIPELSYLKPLESQLNRSLLAEKKEDERFNEKLKTLLEEEPLNASVCLPLYLANPSLHKSIESVVIPSMEKSSICNALYSLSMPDSPEDNTVHSPSLKDSMSKLRMHLKRSRQEDIAFNLHLSTLLDVAQHGESSSSYK